MDVNSLTTAQKWDYIYQMLGIKDSMDYFTSSALQNEFLPIKIIFILFSALFLGVAIYFYFNSSYLRYQFLQDVTEFFSWQAYGLRGISKHLKKLIQKAQSGNEQELRLAILEADELLQQVLEERGYKGENIEAMLRRVNKKMLPTLDAVVQAHHTRNSIMHDVNYKLDVEQSKKILGEYEKAIKTLAV